MTTLYLNNKFKYLIISIVSFISSIVIINLVFFYTNNHELSAKITVLLLFCINLFLFLKYYKIKGDKKKFPILLLFFSVFFRFFEYYLFIFFVYNFTNINIAWITSLVLSFICKFVLFDKIFSKK